MTAHSHQTGADASGRQTRGWPCTSSAEREQHEQRRDHGARARHERARDLVARRARPTSRSTRSGAIAVGVERQQRRRQRRRAAAAHGGRVGGQLRQRLLAPRQRAERVGVADRARDQDPQRVAARGVVRLVRDDRGQLVLAEALERARRRRTPAGAAARRRTPAAARPARPARAGPRSSRSLEHRHPRRDPAVRRRRRARSSTARARARSTSNSASEISSTPCDVDLAARQRLAARRPARRRGSAPRRARRSARAGTRWRRTRRPRTRRAAAQSPFASRRSFSSRSGSSPPMWRAKCASARSPKSSTSAATSDSARRCR